MDEDAAAPVEAGRSKTPARDRIFATAREMFYAHGIRAVGVETIANEAGATKMSLYRNFPSKDELVAECLRDEVREVWEWWAAIVAKVPSDPRKQLEALFEGLAEKAVCSEHTHGCALSNAAIELHEPEHPARQVAVAHKREIHQRLVELTRQAGAPDEELADGLMLLAEGAYLARVTLCNGGPALAVAKAAKTLITAHLGPR